MHVYIDGSTSTPTAAGTKDDENTNKMASHKG